MAIARTGRQVGDRGNLFQSHERDAPMVRVSLIRTAGSSALDHFCG
jgi:hypothetical protein